MRRRHFVALLGSTPFALSPARAQGTMPVVGFLNPVSPETYAFNVAAFREGLAKAGFVEGRNVRIEYRWGRGDYSRLPAMAAELASMNVAAIAAMGDIASARAAKAATSTIPIVFTIGADPVGHGLVSSLNRPGGNLTGVNLFSSILCAKRIELLTRFAPKARRIALAMNSDNFTAVAEQEQGVSGARALGREAFVVNARKPDEIAGALAEALRLRADSYVTASDPLILDRRGEIVAFGQAHGLPGIGFVRQFASAGALLSYGPSITWMYHGRPLRRRDPERRQSGRAPGGAANRFRAGREPQDRGSARARSTGGPPAQRQRGDREISTRRPPDSVVRFQKHTTNPPDTG